MTAESEKINVPLFIHVSSIVPAVFMGANQLISRKGTNFHRLNGRIWSGLMITASISSFWLHTINPGKFSFIHPLSVITIGGVTAGIWAARRGHIKAHKFFMTSAYCGMATAGIFAFVPPRKMARFVSSGKLPWID